MFRYIYSRVGIREVAEDIAQETFMRAWEHRKKFDNKKSSLKNWIFVIATNLLRDFFRKKRPETVELNDNLYHETDLAEARQTDLVNSVFRRVNQLSERDRELLLLRYQADLDINEIAEHMDLDYGAAKMALHRATQKLKSLCNKDNQTL